MLNEMDEQMNNGHAIDHNKIQMLEENNIDARDLTVCVNNFIYCNICNNFSIKPPTISRINQHLNSHNHVVNKLNKDYKEQLAEKDEEILDTKAYYTEFLEQQEEELRSIMDSELRDKDNEIEDLKEHFTNIIEENERIYENKLIERDNYIAKREKYIEKLEKQLKELTNNNNEKDNIIIDNTKEIQKKNEAIEQHKTLSHKNDKTIKELNDKINLLEYSNKYSNKKYSFV
jgi:DNA repair exonuclease SbcCD ATPase subunit